ncbi:hypothetical protein FE810_01940 [Thalassotalea litorea]|uniref:Uncharacterized protein n=1 Tax=Thalassotalea litorea TaxID=2020715 RepID=A0A5R9IR31_9GAMM|nr:hypothetical protein [Thalassotalea litorea]TLU67732.1 hypothetical protein FE810_01940 [Thalassotalea litorea]
MLKKGLVTVVLFVISAWFLWTWSNNRQLESANSLIPNTYINTGNANDVNQTDSDDTKKEGLHQSMELQNERGSSFEIDDAEPDFLDCLPESMYGHEDRKTKFQKYIEIYESKRILAREKQLTSAKPLHYALFATPPENKTRFDLLIEHHVKHPGNPIVSNDIIIACIGSKDTRCRESLISELLISDSNNAALYFSAVLFFLSKGVDEEAIAHIELMEQASFFNERFGERVLIYTQALKGAEVSDFSLNVSDGLVFNFQNVPLVSPIIKWCKANSDDVIRSEACLVLGDQLFDRSKSTFNRTVGTTLQSIVYESKGNSEGLATSVKNRNRLRQDNMSTARDESFIMLHFDEGLARKWLEYMDIYGEIQSKTLLKDEADFLYQTEGRNAECNFVQEALGIAEYISP